MNGFGSVMVSSMIASSTVDRVLFVLFYMVGSSPGRDKYHTVKFVFAVSS